MEIAWVDEGDTRLRGVALGRRRAPPPWAKLGISEAIRRTSDDSVISMNIVHSESGAPAHSHKNFIYAGSDIDRNYMP